MNEMKPIWMASAPRLGPITLLDTTLTLADILPLFSTLLRSLASSGVKLPVICDEPPVISLLTLGKEYTCSSSTMAMLRPRLLRVIVAQSLAPRSFIFMLTMLPCMLSYSELAEVMASPSSTASPFRATSSQ